MRIGCYVRPNVNPVYDRDRILKGIYMNMENHYMTMTLGECVAACVTLGYRYVGVAVSNLMKHF